MVDDDLVRLLEGAPGIDAQEQAFPFVTVDEAGFPHAALLSRSELEPCRDRDELVAVVASRRTRANIERDGRALLIAVEGTTAHYAKLRLVRSIRDDELLGCAFEVAEHKRDSLGIPLAPITFRTSADLARDERWQVSAKLLDRLRHES